MASWTYGSALIWGLVAFFFSLPNYATDRRIVANDCEVEAKKDARFYGEPFVKLDGPKFTADYLAIIII